jgi:hypothetical protein
MIVTKFKGLTTGERLKVKGERKPKQFPSRHSGEGRNLEIYLEIMDSGLRRNDVFVVHSSFLCF